MGSQVLYLSVLARLELLSGLSNVSLGYVLIIILSRRALQRACESQHAGSLPGLFALVLSW